MLSMLGGPFCRLAVRQSAKADISSQSLWACTMYLKFVAQNPSLLEQPVMGSYAECALHALKISSQQNQLESQSDFPEALAYLTHCLVVQLSRSRSTIEQQVVFFILLLFRPL